jgi:hypothetical protein
MVESNFIDHSILDVLSIEHTFGSDFNKLIAQDGANIPPYIEAEQKVPLFHTADELAKYIDHTLLKADASSAQVDELVAEAKEWNFAVHI